MVLPDLLSHEPCYCAFCSGFEKIWRGLYDLWFIVNRNLTLESDPKGKLLSLTDPWTLIDEKVHLQKVKLRSIVGQVFANAWATFKKSHF